jgi:hypothetical protein
MTRRFGPFQIGDVVQHVRSGHRYVVTMRWRDPGMRSYDYEVEDVETRRPDTFHRGEIEKAKGYNPDVDFDPETGLRKQTPPPEVYCRGDWGNWPTCRYCGRTSHPGRRLQLTRAGREVR